MASRAEVRSDQELICLHDGDEVVASAAAAEGVMPSMVQDTAASTRAVVGT